MSRGGVGRDKSRSSAAWRGRRGSIKQSPAAAAGAKAVTAPLLAIGGPLFWQHT